MTERANPPRPASASHWFRVYNTLVDDPKVQQLPDALFKALVNLWCLASQNGGALPPTDDVAYKLRMKPARAAELVKKLLSAGLLEREGSVVFPHNWGNRQFQSDCSTPRIQRFRERQRQMVGGVGRHASDTADEAAQNHTRETRPGAREAGKNLEAELRKAIVQAFAAAHASGVPDTDRAGVWLSQGYDAGIILAVVTEIVARKPNLASLNYFDAPIREAHAARAPKRLPVGEAPQLKIEDAVRMFATTRHWSRYAGPAPGLAGCRAPPSLLAQYGLLPDGRVDPNKSVAASIAFDRTLQPEGHTL
jgi:hypothetical protein